MSEWHCPTCRESLPVTSAIACPKCRTEMHQREPQFETRIPCACGSLNASWHGDRIGLRSYCCDSCYEAMQ